MAYNASYSSTDVPVVVIDLGVTVIAAMVSFGTLIGLLIVYNYIKKKSPRF